MMMSLTRLPWWIFLMAIIAALMAIRSRRVDAAMADMYDWPRLADLQPKSAAK